MKKEQTVYFLTERRAVSGGAPYRFLPPLASGLLCAGIAGCIFSLGGFPFFALPAAVSAAAAALIIWLRAVFQGKNYAASLCVIAAALLFTLLSDSAIRGAYLWIDQLQTGWNKMFGTFLEGFPVESAAAADILTVELVVGLLIAALVSDLLYGKKIAALTLIAFFLLGIDLLLAASLPLWVGTLLFGGWLLAWCGCLSGFDRRLLVWLVCAAAAVAALPSITGGSWEYAGQKMQQAVSASIARLRYGQDSLPQGDLRKAAGLLSGNDVQLELEMAQPEELYLRGYIGAQYENALWRPLDASAFRGEFRGMLDWLAQQDFQPGAQYAGYVQADAASHDEPVSVSVKVKDASRKYVYLPETVASFDADGSWQQDWSLQSNGLFGSRYYTFTYYPTEGPAELEYPADWLYRDSSASQQSFIQAERTYRAFVYENYLELSDVQRTQLERAFFNADAWEETDQLYTITSRIRTVLRILAQYSSTPPQLPAGREFVEWFLHDGRQGNSAYFATTAVLAYRAAGIPARYAEGYLLTGKQAESSGAAVTLTGQNAHAWVEIYVDGIGWRAVEVTPGFYSQLYQADILVAVPNDALEGTSGETAGIPSAEEYELPDMDAVQEDTKKDSRSNSLSLLPLVLVIVLLLLLIAKNLLLLVQDRRYQKLSYADRFLCQYDKIVVCMTLLLPQFSGTQPLEMLEAIRQIDGLDIGLYVRTIHRLERYIYGQVEPDAQSVAAAEALADNLRHLPPLRKHKWKQWMHRLAAAEKL